MSAEEVVSIENAADEFGARHPVDVLLAGNAVAIISKAVGGTGAMAAAGILMTPLDLIAL